MISIFSIFFNQTTFSQKRFILSINILFGLLSPGLLGIAIWFKEPIFSCKSDNKTFECTQEIACSGLYKYHIDYSKSPLSIATELELVCDRRYLKRFLISCYFLGGLIGCFFNILVHIPAKNRKLAISLVGILYGLANLGMVFFAHNLDILPIFMATISFSWIVMHPFCFMIMNENFQGDLTKSVIMIMMLFYGATGIIYSTVAYFLNASYIVLFTLIGILVIADSLYLLLSQSVTEPKPLAKKVFF